jgi:hypothetical protein
MMPSIRRLLALAALMSLLLTGAASIGRAEPPPPLPGASLVFQPANTGTASPETLPLPTQTQDRPPAYVLPPVDRPLVVEGGGLDPLLDRPQAPLPGFFINVESSVVHPHLTNQLQNMVVLSSTRTDLVQFPGNDLDWVVMPSIALGYRLADGWGAFELSYRFLISQGSTSFAGSGGAPGLGQKTRLDVHVVDLDYLSREYSLGPDWEMRWAIGARGLFLYFDSQLSLLNGMPSPGDVLSQFETNQLYAYGAHAQLDLSRRLPFHGWAVFGRFDGSGMVGRVGQTYSEVLAPTPDGSLPVFGQTRINRTAGIPTLATEVGLSYTVPGWNNSRFLIGYQYETFFDIGRIGETGARAQVVDQGIFLRAEFNF